MRRNMKFLGIDDHCGRVVTPSGGQRCPHEAISHNTRRVLHRRDGVDLGVG